jgi:hypothetical protein
MGCMGKSWILLITIWCFMDNNWGFDHRIYGGSWIFKECVHDICVFEVTSQNIIVVFHDEK